MIEEIQRLLDHYLSWLKEKTTLRQIDDWVEITTPYLDRHNDYIQIYVKKEKNGYVLTDDGYTITDLTQTGCKLESPKRQELLNLTLNGFGVKLNSDALQVRASTESFAQQKHNLVQAILAVNDMFYMAEPNVKILFFEDVETWLASHEIRYTPRVKFTGKSGYDHLFDFVIPKSRKQPERILQTVTRPGKDIAQAVAFSWIDTKEVRSPDTKAYAILNDVEKEIATGVEDALSNYGIIPVPWSKKEIVEEELTV